MYKVLDDMIKDLLNFQCKQVLKNAISIHTSIMPDLPFVEDLKSQLEAKEVVITRVQDEVKKLFRETEEKSLEIAKQAVEI